LVLAEILSRENIVHVHAHFASEPAAIAELAKMLHGTDFSISAHAKDIYLSSEKALRRKISNAAFVVTCTEYNRRYLDQINTSATPIHRVYHGFDLRRFRNHRSETYAHIVTVFSRSPEIVLDTGR